MASTRTELQKKAQNDLFQHALFRWESALIIAITIILAFLMPKPFPFFPGSEQFGWGWLVLGLIGLALMIYSSLTDAENNARVLLNAFQRQFDLGAIKDRELRDDVESALEYQRRIEEQISTMNKTLVRERMEDTAGRISDWIENVYKLALRVDSYRRDDLIARDLRTLPDDIKLLRAEHVLERDPGVLSQRNEVIESKEQHLQSLRDLDTRITQAQLQMEQSITSLGTLYSQIQLVDAQDVNSGRAERLRDDIQEQVNRLNDLVDSINEVYSHSRF